MPRVRLLLSLVLLALSACAAVPPPQPAPAFYVMRHLHTPEGQRDPDLTLEGQRLAVMLAEWFAADRPAAIYVSQWKRTQQTAAPLAERLGLTPIVYDAADADALIARLRTERAPVLVVGHSNTVPDIVERLGGARPAPLEHHDFGDIWIVAADGATQKRSLGGR